MVDQPPFLEEIPRGGVAGGSDLRPSRVLDLVYSYRMEFPRGATQGLFDRIVSLSLSTHWLDALSQAETCNAD